jgi:hypothetical protein
MINFSVSGLSRQDPRLKKWSKKVPKRRRRTVKNDRKIIAVTRISGSTATVSVLAPSLSVSASTSAAPIILPALHTATKTVPANDNPDTALALRSPGFPKGRRLLWAHTTDLAKLTFANRVLSKGEIFLPFTLNLGWKAIKAANDNAKGFVDYFRRRVTKELKRKLGYCPDYWFIVHVKKGRPHAHGAIGVNDNEKPRVKEALEIAGGRWRSTHPQYQVRFSRRGDPDGWVRYCLGTRSKDFVAAQRLFGSAVSITMQLRRKAKHCLES